MIIEQSITDGALVVIQNVADSTLIVMLECMCQPLRNTDKGVQLLALTGESNQIVEVFQLKADADLRL